MTGLLDIRNAMKAKKPQFLRQDLYRRKRINHKWRKPKGIHSKIRHHFKGRRKMPSPGYKSPSVAKGLHASGLRIVNIFSISDIQKIKKNNEGVIVAKSVGTKKKLEIFKKAKELGVQILNLNVDEQIKKIENMMALKKKQAKETRKETREQEPKPKEQKEKTISDEGKKEAEKKEKDAVLTKRT